MNRISPEQVVEAFKATGIKPMKGEFFEGIDAEVPNCACGLGVLYYSKFNQIDFDNVVANHFDTEYSGEYRFGFVNGFDDTFGYEVRVKNATYDRAIGYQDGVAAREALIKEGIEFHGHS